MSTESPSPKGQEPHEAAPRDSIESEGFAPGQQGRDIFFIAVETTRMPMVVADPRQPDVPIVFANQAFLDMTGYAREEVVGRNCRFLQGPDTDREVVDKIRRAVHAEQEITTELLNYRKDGSTFWNALFMTPIRNERGEVTYFYSSQLDISRRHDAEAALRQAQKMEAIGQLTGGIAHDFNNLLQVIAGNVDVAALLTREVEDERLPRALKRIRDAARKSGALTQQLLAFARKQQLQGRVVNLNDQVRQLAGETQSRLGPRITLNLELAPALWNTRLDPAQLHAAWDHLLANSVEAMSGEGVVTLHTANLEVDEAGAARHGLPKAGRFVAVSVTDDGTGIPAENLPRVMDPFFSTKPFGEGAGLGLSMVYGFAKQSGGTATVYSGPGLGTTVRLYFPVTSEEVPIANRPRDPQRRRGPARVLIVDDRQEIAEMASMILGEAGHRCVESHSADAALVELGKGEPFDLLLTDLIMPGGMNGVLLAREAQRRQPGLNVLLMTGFADGAPDRWGGEHFPIIFKPFVAEELIAQVGAALDGVPAHAHPLHARLEGGAG